MNPGCDCQVKWPVPMAKSKIPQNEWQLDRLAKLNPVLLSVKVCRCMCVCICVHVHKQQYTLHFDCIPQCSRKLPDLVCAIPLATSSFLSKSGLLRWSTFFKLWPDIWIYTNKISLEPAEYYGVWTQYSTITLTIIPLIVIRFRRVKSIWNQYVQ